ncbi:putative sporulation protein YtxC [Clostridium estertheticum]|uniref:Sporulation protein n=1 Tax=Clostridium estertheticum subsp. estertheticum TaxID=1552 RepID=A0A1J0GK74_9CLOT|nr:putative sporulation protein YtxC [Clostridium estertheticum]APC41731.1 sporulation protein [Clostridium estertheticum subsp. estertheticum]MBU3073434.1 putative sporulation protein YtxC [Clostridium estertheticum]MBU3163325.1 putative sporulation protein YtxC [Clostridium estertheticum]MBZ9616386.1 putative sporulation protein YtxC [Clostridium estertheticum subsp. laramiense]MCB2339829.1 putative sporulation protein YtxC [Clostridium estertheticum]
MLLLTVVYNRSMEYIIDEINAIKKCFEYKKTILGVSESIVEDMHFIKFFCSDNNICDSSIKAFNLNVANMLYKIVTIEFCKKGINDFLTETYFFLQNDEIKQVKPRIQKALFNEGEISGPNMVYCINRKNVIIDKITRCIEENNEINISGFLTFRSKELNADLESIVDKVVEDYMVEKEYNEFIKLLKYFVDIQESKVDEVNILIEKDGNYYLRDKEGNNLVESMMGELPDVKFDSIKNQEELIISTMISSAPKKVIIHCVQHCKNKELIETISKVFTDKVYYCDTCSECEKIKNGVLV